MNESIKRQVFRTEDNNILIVKVAKKSNADITITANEITPISRDTAVQRVRDSLEEGEYWRMAVESKNTELGLDEWVKMVIDSDGDLTGFDNSLFPEELEINGETYIFESGSCGCMHESILKVWKDAKPFYNGHLREMHDIANFKYLYKEKHKRNPTKKVIEAHEKETKQILKDTLKAWNLLKDDADYKQHVFDIAKDIIMVSA